MPLFLFLGFRFPQKPIKTKKGTLKKILGYSWVWLKGLGFRV